MRVRTIGHGTRPIEELIDTLLAAEVRTLVDVRRFPGSRRNPQFNGPALAQSLAAVGIVYAHRAELGGRLANEPGEEQFPCIRVAAFRAYAARMTTIGWQRALAAALDTPEPCFMCAETLWTKCHRRLIAELLHAQGNDVQHLIDPRRTEPHRPWEIADARDGHLYLCNTLVA